MNGEQENNNQEHSHESLTALLLLAEVDIEKALELVAIEFSNKEINYQVVHQELKSWWESSSTTGLSNKQVITILRSATGHIVENIGQFDVLTPEQVTIASLEYKVAQRIIEEQAQRKESTSSTTAIEELYELIQAGYQNRTQLILSNMRLVAFIAKKYSRENKYYEEVLQEGMRGLIKAVDKFDPERNIQFSTYATFWIKRYMSRWLVENKLISLPLYMSTLINKIQKLELLGIDDVEISESRKKLLAEALNTFHIVDIDSERENGEYLAELLPADQDSNDQLISQWEQEDLQDTFEQILTAREEIILKLYYGLDNNPPHSEKEIGDRLKYDHKYIKMLRKAALEKLFNYSKIQGAQTYRQTFDLV